MANLSVFLYGALAGRLAVRVRMGLNADCTDLQMREGGVLVGEVISFGGVLALIEAPQHFPKIATVRPGVFPLGTPDPTRSGRIHEISVHLQEEQVSSQSVDITQAPMLVIGGREVEGRFDLLRQACLPPPLFAKPRTPVLY